LPKPATLLPKTQCCRFLRQCRRFRRQCRGSGGDNVAGFGDNVAVFGDIVAGVDGALVNIALAQRRAVKTKEEI